MDLSRRNSRRSAAGVREEHLISYQPYGLPQGSLVDLYLVVPSQMQSHGCQAVELQTCLLKQSLESVQ